MKVVDAILQNDKLKIRIPRSYGYAEYEHDEENGDTRIAGFRFRRLGGYDGDPGINVLNPDGKTLDNFSIENRGGAGNTREGGRDGKRGKN